MQKYTLFDQKLRKFIDKISSLHFVTQFDKNINFWFSCNWKYYLINMKIQPVTSYRNIYSKGLNKPSENFANLNKKETSNINKLNNFYYFPINFTSLKRRTYSTDKKELAEKSGDFIIPKIADIPCPACGKKMLNQTKFNQIAEELASHTPDQYLDCLGKYTEYMRPVEESVYNELYKLSQKEGNSKDIRTLLVSLRNRKLPILQDTQMRLIKKMRALAKSLPEDERSVLLNKIEGLQQVVKKNNTTAPFRRKIMIDRISKVSIRNQKKYEKLQSLAKSFPTSSDMNSAWIVKYSGKNKQNEDWASYDIALRFLSSSIANTDHIIAYDIESNHDDISNYLSMHSACNSQKGNKPFLQWLNEDKSNRLKYLQDYFEKVNDLIKTKKISKKKYKHYVAYATQTIFEASKGQVKLPETEIDPKLYLPNHNEFA